MAHFTTMGALDDPHLSATGPWFKVLPACKSWCRRRDLNPHGLEAPGILSPLRIPFRHSGTITGDSLRESRPGRLPLERVEIASALLGQDLAMTKVR
jgi:hypothetical protein